MHSSPVFEPEHPRSFAKNFPWEAHLQLAQFNSSRLVPRMPTEDWREELRDEAVFLRLEGEVLELERIAVTDMASSAPTSLVSFRKWFKELRERGPGQHDPLFPWLAEEATRSQMKWFIQQEVAGEAGFEDLTALTQIRIPTRAKLEMARNYWDEMGRGRANGMHGPMLARLAGELELPRLNLESIVVEALALGNIMLGLAANRRYAYHSIGALGVIEMTAPDRSLHVYRGLKRLGLSGEAQRYFLLHSTLDKQHSESWNVEVIDSLIKEHPEVAHAIAEGALMRLNAGARCFDRYRQKLWGN